LTRGWIPVRVKKRVNSKIMQSKSWSLASDSIRSEKAPVPSSSAKWCNRPDIAALTLSDRGAAWAGYRCSKTPLDAAHQGICS
jgi:hypothetical protein